jgi:hypothetical protein
MRGDILFYFATRHPIDWIISRFTNGPFVHVSVDLGDGTDVSVMHDGVQIRPLPAETAFHRLTLPQGSRIEEGVKYM